MLSTEEKAQVARMIEDAIKATQVDFGTDELRIAQIQRTVDMRDDSKAMYSACGEYNCPCHYDIPFLLQYIKEKLACQ